MPCVDDLDLACDVDRVHIHVQSESRRKHTSRNDKTCYPVAQPGSSNSSQRVFTKITLEATSSDGREQRNQLLFKLCTCPAAFTGGYLWSSGLELSRWLFANSHALAGRRVLEIGCGLGLPSLVASRFAKKVVATDYLPELLDTVRANAVASGVVVANDCDAAPFSSDGLSTSLLDFTSTQSVIAAGVRAWDVLLFTDCIFNAQAGLALPHVLFALLRKTSGFAVGVFPPDKRPGTDSFWKGVGEVGLSWHESNLRNDGVDEVLAVKPPGCSLYIFWLPDKGGAADTDDDITEQLMKYLETLEDDIVDIAPLFVDI